MSTRQPIAHLSSTSRRRDANQTTGQQVRDRATVGVFTPQAALLFILTGCGLFYYFQSEKARVKEERRKQVVSKKVGRALVGGPFQLVTHNGEMFTNKELLGKWSLVYFGFTNCPDICPEELDKMGACVNEINNRYKDAEKKFELLPIFVSVDPARDDVPAMKRYVAGAPFSVSRFVKH